MDETPRYGGSVLLVGDLEASRRFYEGLFGMKVVTDYGPCVGFEGGLSLWLREAALALTGEGPVPRGGRDLELYFETPELDAFAERLRTAGVRWVQGVHEAPWGQRSLRVEDPEGNLVEVAEPLETLVRRLAEGGMGAEAIAERTSMALEDVRRML